VPAQQPELAAAIVAAAGCPVVKVKAPPGPDPVVDRTLAAISDALAAVPDPAAHRLRLDANGQWGVDEACAQLGRLRRVLDSHPSPVAIEYVEQPCATVTECVAVRRRTGIPVALDESVRLSDGGPDLRGPVQLPAGAADVDALVCKPIPLGGISATLALVQASRAIGVPVVISGSLDTSLGLSSVARVAALVSSPLAAGVGTGLLLAADLTDEPLLPMAGYLPTRRVVLSRERLAAADPGPATAAYWRQAAAVAWWAGAAERTAGLHAAVLGQRGMALPW